METDFLILPVATRKALYSLEKLIEWKLIRGTDERESAKTLYSLEKLIEWKLILLLEFP